MKKHHSVYIYGAIVVLLGIFLLFSGYFTFQTIKMTVGFTIILGAILALLKALSRQRKQIEFSYHEIHSLAMLGYGLAVLLFANSLDTLIHLSAFLFFFYTFSEIIFSNWVLNLGRAVNFKIIVVRGFLGLMVGLGTVGILYYFASNNIAVIESFGVLFIIIGINIMLYVPIMKRNELNES